MTADARIFLVLPMHHGHGVPTDQTLDAPLQQTIARIRHLFLDRDRIDVGSIELDRDFNSGLPRVLNQRIKQRTSAMRASAFHDLVECLKPFVDFLFGINFAVQRKLENAIVNFVSGHRYLNNPRNS